MARKAKTKRPKTVAGIKVPKTVRKSGLLDTLVSTPLAREILADALVAAAAAAAAALVKKRPSAEQVARAGATAFETGADAASATQDVVQKAVGGLAELVTDAARQNLPNSIGHADDDKSTDGATAAEPDSKAKKVRHRKKASHE